MGRGSADQIIVVVKPRADESMVTYLRVKLTVRDKDVKGKGSGILTKGIHIRRLPYLLDVAYNSQAGEVT